MIKILHTADWHIGQLFHQYDRTYEHQCFVNWLLETLTKEQIDVLLISGDIFDISNPAAKSIQLFYNFLNKATKQNPNLQIIITAGNHDSAARLEAPKPLLESSKVQIIGVIQKKADGSIDYDKLLIPMTNANNQTVAWCVAVPFLRLGDYPVVKESQHPYVDGVRQFYKEACEAAQQKALEGQPIIGMGHLHAQKAEVGEQDENERLIMGGVEGIAADAFPPELQYVALGHIHKAQRIGGQEHIRYSGSPLPMSFSEMKYKHQVVTFELTSEGIQEINPIEIPVAVPLQRVPQKHSPVAEVLAAIEALPNEEVDWQIAPYLEVRVLLEEPEPALRYKVETALKGKAVRLAKIDVKYHTAKSNDNTVTAHPEELHDLKPEQVFKNMFKEKYQTEIPDALLQLFQMAAQEVNDTEA